MKTGDVEFSCVVPCLISNFNLIKESYYSKVFRSWNLWQQSCYREMVSEAQQSSLFYVFVRFFAGP